MTEDSQEIRKKLEELEKENASLKKIIADSGDRVRETTTKITTYKGHPVISFSGMFRPFSIGLKKAIIILDKIDDVQAFVESYTAREE
jgi:hypothetical protein